MVSVENYVVVLQPQPAAKTTTKVRVIAAIFTVLLKMSRSK